MFSVVKLSTRFALIAGIFIGPTLAWAQTDLTESVRTIIKAAGFSEKGIGLYIQAIDKQQSVVSLQAETPFNPASVIKIVTTAIALDALGAGYRWTTELSYTGNIKNNVLQGDLYFKGNGDPYMTPERFWRLLSRINIYGIQNIKGDVYFDNSYFNPGKMNYAAFDNQPYRTYNVGPNAVLIGFQATEFHMSTQAKKIKISTFPDSPIIKVINKIKKVKGSCGRWKKRINVSTKNTNGTLNVTFTGRFASRCDKKTLYLRVSESTDHFQHYFLPIWQQVGGKLSGTVKQGLVPRHAKSILKGDSISLSDAIKMINKYSNNVMTRQVLLTLGAHEFGVPGTTKKGIRAISRWLRQQQFDDQSLRLDNGSGLSRKTRISAKFLGKILHHVYQQAYMPEFISSLPMTGYDGTMANRFKNDPIKGQAHIKTGLLDFVQSMAGYITAANGKRYVVVLLHNDPKAHTKAATRLQNKIIRLVYNLN